MPWPEPTPSGSSTSTTFGRRSSPDAHGTRWYLEDASPGGERAGNRREAGTGTRHPKLAGTPGTLLPRHREAPLAHHGPLRGANIGFHKRRSLSAARPLRVHEQRSLSAARPLRVADIPVSPQPPAPD